MGVEMAKLDMTRVRLVRWASAGLAVVCVAAVIQLAGVSELCRPLWWAVVVFSAAIPLPAAGLLMSGSQERHGLAITSRRYGIPIVFGQLSGFAGIVCLFWHFGWIPLVVFLVATACGYGCWMRTITVLVRKTRSTSAGPGQEAD